MVLSTWKESRPLHHLAYKGNRISLNSNHMSTTPYQAEVQDIHPEASLTQTPPRPRGSLPSLPLMLPPCTLLKTGPKVCRMLWTPTVMPLLVLTQGHPSSGHQDCSFLKSSSQAWDSPHATPAVWLNPGTPKPQPALSWEQHGQVSQASLAESTR